jgi:DNA-directed RNA polymerase specialized sigma subunit
MKKSSIPYLPVSENRKSELERIIREANLLVQEHSLKAGVGCDSLRTRIASGEEFLQIPEYDAEKILLAKDVEWEILCAYSNLTNKIVNKWVAKSVDVSLSEEDLMSEAHASAIKAIRGFTQDGVMFSTFLHVCINNRLSELCMRSGSVSKIPRSVAKLKMQYGTLASEEGATFDEVVRKMGISEKQVKELVFTLRGVVDDSHWDRDDCAMRLVDDSDQASDDLESEARNRIASVLKQLDLSELERAVLDGFMSSSDKMGLSSVSKKLINPNTKKPYSRMAFSYAWNRVKEKIEKAFSDAA